MSTPCLQFQFRTGRRRASWAAPAPSGWFIGQLIAERERRRAQAAKEAESQAAARRERAAASRERQELARRLVAEFVPPEQVPAAAVALQMLRFAHPTGRITRQMVLDRMRATYEETAL